MYCGSIGVPHIYLPSVDFGIAKTLYVRYPVLIDKIPTERKTPT